ncbi:hypothetical protein CVT24_012402 [Panaeolus cyanescens]|uniref:Uncharacterized protein n=1 Tax=Panaeolus cyanescens TaxID=181874 RepID=A0A409YJ78_9AGAR|nr:hypothetical protein CVT24_012402 [Panaeolus cyanescens]
MQSRRPGLSPLAIVLPHPPLPHRRSSLLSINSASSPHTPRSCPSPCLSIYYPANRKSTDSWNSSNADEMDCEWKPEQTLDGLPAHLITPFNGPVPPTNLLDKVARGVIQAKGTTDWPHSIRATRVKLLELARARAKDEAANDSRRFSIKEEVEIAGSDSEQQPSQYFLAPPITTVGVGPRRPIYRQSSMDFIKPSTEDIKNNPTIARLSNRLQRSDRLFPNPAYHPYSRSPRSKHRDDPHRRSSSPPTDVPSLINPSTPSSSTLSSLTSAQPRVLRRSTSTFSTSSMFSNSSDGMSIQLGLLADPRIQRVRRSDSMSGAPPPPPKDSSLSVIGFKRAPSYGALRQEARAERMAASPQSSAPQTPTKMSICTPGHTPTHARNISTGSCASSDEEEKARSKSAKKLRTVAPRSPPPSSTPSSPMVLTTSPTPRLSTRTRPMGNSSMDIDMPPAPPADDLKPKSKLPKPRLKGVAASNENGPGTLTSPSAKEKERGSKTKAHKTTGSSSSTASNVHQDKAEGQAGKARETKHKAAMQAGRKDKEDGVINKEGKKRPVPMNLQRNPSMFGAELPHMPETKHKSSRSKESNNFLSSRNATFGWALGVHNALAASEAEGNAGFVTPTKLRSPSPPARSFPAIRALSPPVALSPAPLMESPKLTTKRKASRALSPIHVPKAPFGRSSATPSSPTPLSPAPTSPAMSPPASEVGNSPVRTLRRVRRLAPARRISFSSLAAPSEQPEGAAAGGDEKGCLGSAFQLI